MHTSIESKEISVVVRGLVVGQGEHDAALQFTKRALVSVRQHMPEAELILSTWKGSDVSGLAYDELVLSDEPAPLYMLEENGSKRFISTNNQIITNQRGLQKASRPYVLSLRSDTCLTGIRFLEYFERYNQHPPENILEKRFVVLPTFNPARSLQPFLFNTADWFYFGRTDDLRNLFDIPLMDERSIRTRNAATLPRVKDNLGPEQYVWTQFLLKNGYEAHLPSLSHYDERLAMLSEQSYARYAIMVPAHSAGIVCLKMPHAGYGARPWLSQGLYTWTDYKRLYKKYCDSSLVVLQNPLESLAYSSMLTCRRVLRVLFPFLYKTIVNSVRRLHGSTNLLK